ncbi:hypothetical protein [Sporolactobacillus terrae]|uniref:hypothetical protein n=1 Tax=Sporolactobacillus terrae TaxID=269673 RepID=UPI001119E4BE|nr:hypothetical protein [Sporolactobacillus terrae]
MTITEEINQIKSAGYYPVKLNTISNFGREILEIFMTEEDIIKYVEKLCDDLIVYIEVDKEVKELFDIAIKSADGIYSLHTVIEQCEEGQFEDTLEILLDNSQE